MHINSRTYEERSDITTRELSATLGTVSIPSTNLLMKNIHNFSLSYIFCGKNIHFEELKDMENDENGSRVVPLTTWFFSDSFLSCTKENFHVDNKL